MYYKSDITSHGDFATNKTVSMSIRISENDLEMLKKAAELERYSSYSEFVRRTALIEAYRIMEENKQENKQVNNR